MERDPLNRAPRLVRARPCPIDAPKDARSPREVCARSRRHHCSRSALCDHPCDHHVTPPSPAARAIKVARAAPRKHAPGRVSTPRARVSTLRRVSTAQIRGNAPGRGNADRGRVYAPRRVNAAQTVETRPGVEARPKSKKTRPIAKTQFGSVQTRPAVEKRPIPRFHGTTVALKVVSTLSRLVECLQVEAPPKYFTAPHYARCLLHFVVVSRSKNLDVTES